MTFRFSPGYGDYPIEMQKEYLRILDAPRKIGLTTGDSCLLVPSKSVTAVLGISDNPIERRKRGCAICSMKGKCRFRRNGNIVVFKNFSNFSEYLNQKNFILLDGATGTLIQKSGVKYDHVPEVLNITHPELIESFHRRYIDAGSDIVYANTFGANAYKLQDSGYSVEEIIGAGVKIAKKPLRVQTLLLPLISVR